jgi:hypothetical protein
VNSDNVIDVDARVVASTIESAPFPAEVAVEAAAAVAAAAAPPAEVSELKLVPAIIAQNEIVKANPALILMRQLIARIELELPTINVGTKEGEERARKLRAECVKLRTTTDKAYEEWNKPVLAAQRGIREVVKQVETGITPVEAKLHAMIQGVETAREAEKQRKIKVEEDRINALREKITSTFVSVPIAAVKMTSAEIDAKVRELQDLVITDAEDSFGEFSLEAEGLRARTISEIMDLGRAKREQEDQAARLEEQRLQQLEADRRATAERALQAKVDAIKAKAFDAFGKTAAQIKEIHAQLQDMEPLALEFGEMYGAASAAWQQTLHMVANAMASQQQLEEQQAEAKRQQDELDRQRREREAEELRQAQAAAAAAREKAEREDRIEKRIVNLRLNGEHLEALSTQQLVEIIDRVNKLAIDQDAFGERQAEAEELRTQVLAKLGDAYTAAFQAQKRRDEEQAAREEQERIRAAEFEERQARALDSEAANFDEIADNVIGALMEADYPCEMGDRKLVAVLLTNSQVQSALIKIAQGARA